MTAKEAREKAQWKIGHKHEDQRTALLNTISEAAGKGKFAVSIQMNHHEALSHLAYFTAKGYKAQVVRPGILIRPCSYLQINWSE